MDFNPVLWREWHRNRQARWARIVAGVYITLATGFSLMVIVRVEPHGPAPYVNAFQVSIGLLYLSVIAATSLAEERVRGSLDVLMTTPMSTAEIVIGKWLGTFRLVPPLAILPMLVIIGVAEHQTRWPVALLAGAFVLSSGAAVTSLGLAMATWNARLGRAVGLTVTLYLLITVGWLFLIIGITSDRESVRLVLGSPWLWAGAMTAHAQHIPTDFNREWDAAVVWTWAYALTALALMAATLATFDRCLDRVSVRFFPRRPVPVLPQPQVLQTHV
jgi:ABC-type Na+ efflux pump permease subunit